MTTDTIKQLHASGGAAKLSELAARENPYPCQKGRPWMSHMHITAADRCIHCDMGYGQRMETYCTRFATDLTSAAEFEKAKFPMKYQLTITTGDEYENGVYETELALYVLGVNRSGSKDWILLGIFSNESEALNRCAATLYAIAHEMESNQQKETE